ncbi:DUF3010 family protein [Marinicellulosiphila megalodicopiae]|uniref:DUF3010 family protein n=1 Tax=Marinicellulosiphila megalodicopiae TaxID=2724896 RepID=UPI003BAE6619
MRVCAVELTGKEMNLCMLEKNEDMFTIVECRSKKITLSNDDDQSQVQGLQKQIVQLFDDYKIDKVVVKTRMKSGKFSGSSTSFKIEAILQLLPNYEVKLLAPKLIKETNKASDVHIEFEETGLKKFQEPAFETALAYFQL